MELKVNELVVPERITWNYEELKTELTEKTELYATVVYTEDNIKQAKADRAALNKLKTALNDERLRREREYMKPFNEFKAEVNEIIAIIDKPVAAIDKQVKEFERKEQEEKKKKIEELFAGLPNKPEWMKLEQIFDVRWLNKSVTFRMIEDNMLGWLGRIDTESKTIAELSEGAYEAMDEYKRTLDLGRAIAVGQRQARVQREKKEAELKAAEAKLEAMEKKPLPWSDGYAEGVEQRREEQKQEEHKQEEQTSEDDEIENHREWIKFEALLNMKDAEALRAFCETRGIQIRAI